MRPRRPRRRARVLFGALVLSYLGVAVFGGCADRMILYPSVEPLDAEGAARTEVPVPGRTPVEAYTVPSDVPPGQGPAAYLLIFDGNGGRAELAVHWGKGAAPGRAVEVTSINYPGYGQSPGPAGLKTIPPAALAAFDAVKAKAGDKPVVVWGASLGTTAALHVAAHRPVAGLILTNPPPLKQLIMQHHGWWNLWLAAIPVSRGVPDELDNLANAAACKAPALFTSANDDGIVPAKYAQRVIDAYAGPKHVVRHPGGHNDPAGRQNPAGWKEGVDWLWSQVTP
ncbi:MAG TPA: alpha/beta fold hydrolase [Humisphaera sp.]